MSLSYASGEIIVEIIDITEKCSPGFVLITQVTALLVVKGRGAPPSRDITRRCPGNNVMLRSALHVIAITNADSQIVGG